MERFARFLDTFEFSSPQYLWMGSLLALLLIFLPAIGRRRGLAMDLRYWKTRVNFRSKRVWILLIAIATTTILFAAAWADPQTVTKQSIPIYGKPIMAVVDVSGSMQYVGKAGEELTSFEKAREILFDVIGQNWEADYGLLLFSSENYIARYFAPKGELLRDTLDNKKDMTEISFGTRTADALEKARRFLTEKIQAQDQAILLISDLKESPVAAAATAQELEKIVEAGIKVFVVVMSEEVVEESDIFEDPRPPQLRMDDIEVVEMRDEYGLDQLNVKIGAMASSPIREEEIASKKSLIPQLSPYILALVTVCLVLSESYFRRIP
jgi:hypothetical protein